MRGEGQREEDLLQGQNLSIHHQCLTQWAPCPIACYGRLAPCASGTTFSVSVTCHSECQLITRHMHSPPIHRRHYSGTNQQPEKDNVSWKTTRVLITDTLSHAYWLSPGGISKISWICKMERWNERCSSEWKTFEYKGCAGVIGDANKPAIRMH